MQKREFFGVLLLVSLVSTVLFAGVVLSTGGPSISVYPAIGITASSDVYIRVTGTGWATGAPITLYWDQQNDNHTFAIVTPSTYGSFRLDQLEIETVPIGLHTIIAVQGLNMATATYTVTATLPPDDRLLGPIQQIENKLDSTTSGLPGIQSNFTTVLSNVAAIEGKLDNATFGLPGIQSNFTALMENLTKLFGPGGIYNNIGQVQCFGDSVLATHNGTIFEYQYGGPGGLLVPRRIQITLQPYGLDPGENVTIFRWIGGNHTMGWTQPNNIEITGNGCYTYEFEACKWGIETQVLTAGFSLDYSVCVIYQPPA